MKKIIVSSPKIIGLGLIILIFSFFFLSPNIQADSSIEGTKSSENLKRLEIMPDNPFYFLKIWYEKIVLFFTFDATKKAERYKAFAEKRVYEMKKMAEEGKDSLIKKAKNICESYLNKAQEKLEKAVKKAVEQKKEKLIQELEKKIEEIKIKIKETINL